MAFARSCCSLAFAASVVSRGSDDERSDGAEADEQFDDRSILLSASAARELQLDRGDFVEFQVGLKRERLRVSGVLPPAALQDFGGVVDIATAQWVFERLGKLSRINLRLATGSSPEQVKKALADILPPTVRVTTPGQATDDALRLSRAYRSESHGARAGGVVHWRLLCLFDAVPGERFVGVANSRSCMRSA